MTTISISQVKTQNEQALTLNIETLKDLSPLNADQVRGGGVDQRSKTIDCPV